VVAREGAARAAATRITSTNRLILFIKSSSKPVGGRL